MARDPGSGGSLTLAAKLAARRDHAKSGPGPAGERALTRTPAQRVRQVGFAAAEAERNARVAAEQQRVYRAWTRRSTVRAEAPPSARQGGITPTDRHGRPLSAYDARGANPLAAGLAKLPGGHTGVRALGQIGEGIIYSPGAAVMAAQAISHDLSHPREAIRHPLRTGETGKLIGRVAHETAQDFRHPKGREGYLAMDVASLALPVLRSASAGTLAAREGSSVTRAIVKPSARFNAGEQTRTFDFAGGHVKSVYSRSPTGEAAQRVYDRVLGLHPDAPIPQSPLLQKLAARRMRREVMRDRELQRLVDTARAGGVIDKRPLRMRGGPAVETDAQRRLRLERGRNHPGAVPSESERLAARYAEMGQHDPNAPGQGSLLGPEATTPLAPARGRGQAGPGQVDLGGNVTPARTVPLRRAQGRPQVAPEQADIYGLADSSRGALSAGARQGGALIGRIMDTINRVTGMGIFYAKGPGYVIPNVLGNETLSAVDQGVRRGAVIARQQHVRAVLSKTPEGRKALEVLRAVGGSGASEALVIPATGKEGRFTRAHRATGQFYGRLIDQRNRVESVVYHAARNNFVTPEELIALALDPQFDTQLKQAARRAHEALGDFTLGPAERAFVRRIIFIYPWLKASAKIAKHYVDAHPYFVAGSVAGGRVAKDKAEQVLGKLPSFEQGIFPVGSSRVPGVGRLPLTVNPTSAAFLNTLPDVAGTAKAMLAGGVTGRDEPIGYVNPAVASIVAGIFGVDPFTGHKIPAWRSRVGVTLGSYAGAFPATQLGERIARADAPAAQKQGFLLPFDNRSLATGEKARSFRVPGIDVQLPVPTPRNLFNALTSMPGLQVSVGGTAPKPYNPAVGEQKWLAEQVALRPPVDAANFRWNYKREKLYGLFGGEQKTPADLKLSSVVLQARDVAVRQAEQDAGHALTKAERFDALSGLATRFGLLDERHAKAYEQWVRTLPEKVPAGDKRMSQEKAMTALQRQYFTPYSTRYNAWIAQIQGAGAKVSP